VNNYTKSQLGELSSPDFPSCPFIRAGRAQVPRILASFLDGERRALGDACFRQEYECSFEALEGLVYPEFDDCLLDTWPNPQGHPVGGIDWGFHNPFAALWGVHDADDVLCIAGELYARQRPLEDHVLAYHTRAAADPLCPPPETIIWYADPSGPEWIARCRRAGWKVAKGFNDIRLGIAAVTARIRSGRLKVLRPGCPNLVAESRLYRYPSDEERAVHGENPVDDHNHALGALRYLVGKLDHKFIARLRRFPAPGAPGTTNAPADPLAAAALPPEPRPEPEEETPTERCRRLWNNPDAWTVI
jgi:hypothetical protein